MADLLMGKDFGKLVTTINHISEHIKSNILIRM
jgi:hypothetical protein